MALFTIKHKGLEVEILHLNKDHIRTQCEKCVALQYEKDHESDNFFSEITTPNEILAGSGLNSIEYRVYEHIKSVCPAVYWSMNPLPEEQWLSAFCNPDLV